MSPLSPPPRTPSGNNFAPRSGLSLYTIFNAAWIILQTNPRPFGMIMFKSLYLNIPAVVQQKQLTRLANVNGNGMDLADFVSMTVLIALNGDANIPTVNAIPIGPITCCATSRVVLYFDDINNGKNFNIASTDVMIDTVKTTCCLTDPGNVGLLKDIGGLGRHLMNCVMYHEPNRTPTPFADQIFGFWTTIPYTVHKNADATMDEYGSNGKSPTTPPPLPTPPPPSFLLLLLLLLRRFLLNVSIVGHGAVNKKMDANGAIVEHASTMTGATVAANMLDDVEAEEEEEEEDAEAAVAATLANVERTMLLIGGGLELMIEAAAEADDDKDDAAKDGVSILLGIII